MTRQSPQLLRPPPDDAIAWAVRARRGTLAIEIHGNNYLIASMQRQAYVPWNRPPVKQSHGFYWSDIERDTKVGDTWRPAMARLLVNLRRSLLRVSNPRSYFLQYGLRGHQSLKQPQLPGGA